ncbi:unnamed protein product [Prorocentrum cordatum]|uniref:Uncharacterized protein n=1 Tax=Prorocentrum cordatum TaxID=2364126 RepID=A0ABN9W4G6_9DINO|nr:unnamed protein product [Polarella glacialis]
MPAFRTAGRPLWQVVVTPRKLVLDIHHGLVDAAVSKRTESALPSFAQASSRGRRFRRPTRTSSRGVARSSPHSLDGDALRSWWCGSSRSFSFSGT